MDLESGVREAGEQRGGFLLVHLEREQTRRGLDDGDGEAAFAERPGGFEAEQAAADDRRGRFRLAFAERDQGVGVRELAEDMHARAGGESGDGRHERMRADRQHEDVPGILPGDGRELVRGGVNGRHGFAEMKPDAPVCHLFGRGEDELLARERAREVFGETHFCVEPDGRGVEEQDFGFGEVEAKAFHGVSPGGSGSADSNFHIIYSSQQVGFSFRKAEIARFPGSFRLHGERLHQYSMATGFFKDRARKKTEKDRTGDPLKEGFAHAPGFPPPPGTGGREHAGIQSDN